VDDSHGNAYSVWKTLGSPLSPTKAERAALLQAMAPATFVPDATLPVTSGSVKLEFGLPRFGVSLMVSWTGSELRDRFDLLDKMTFELVAAYFRS
jgi:xylan 1,4-beta-xylosidase